MQIALLPTPPRPLANATTERASGRLRNVGTLLSVPPFSDARSGASQKILIANYIFPAQV